MDQRTDEQIAEDVRATLAWDSRIDASFIHASVVDGVVTLSGMVDLFSEKTIAADDAWMIKGVKEVVNDLEVRPGATRADADIIADITNAYRVDNRVDEKAAKVDVRNGVVTLSGTVGSSVEKRAAEEDAWYTAGVVDVVNEIAISPLVTRSDTEIETDVRGALTRDARITDPSRVGVSSVGGVVYLRGAVPTPSQREAAEDDAWFTAGVSGVENEVIIAP